MGIFSLCDLFLSGFHLGDYSYHINAKPAVSDRFAPRGFVTNVALGRFRGADWCGRTHGPDCPVSSTSAGGVHVLSVGAEKTALVFAGHGGGAAVRDRGDALVREELSCVSH